MRGLYLLWGWLSVVWFTAAYVLPPLGVFVACVHLFFVVTDMMMNGAGNAEFAPFNLAGAVLAGAGSGFGNG